MATPNKDFRTDYGESPEIRYCATGIQGWRNSMEDAHVGKCDLGDGNAFFGVFDGHGGKRFLQHLTLVFYRAGSGTLDIKTHNRRTLKQ